MITKSITQSGSTNTATKTTTGDTLSRIKVPHIGPRPRYTKPVIPSGSNKIPSIKLKK